MDAIFYEELIIQINVLIRRGGEPDKRKEKKRGEGC